MRVHTQVTSFLRRLPSGEIIGTHPLDLPRRTLSTKAVWWTMPVDALARAGVAEVDIPGAAHAAEHAAIGMLPLVATSDRWDIGGVSTAEHPDTGLPTILIYDGHPGGAGFAEHAFDAFDTWLSATRSAIASCGCERDVQRVCSRPSAAMATSRSTKPVLWRCCPWSWRRIPPRPDAIRIHLRWRGARPEPGLGSRRPRAQERVPRRRRYGP